MISQCWISSNNKSLLGVKQYTGHTKPQAGAVLVAGFGQPMSDADYFMSKLARRLANFGVYVLQIDLTGHGDSQGNLEDVSISSYYSDLKIAASCMLNITENVYCVGRGLSATLFAKASMELPVQGVVGIEPYCLSGKEVERIWHGIGDYTFEVDDIVKGNINVEGFNLKDEKVTFFGALGADVENLQGQRISGKLLNDLKDFEPYEAIESCSSKSHWIVEKGAAPNEIGIWKPLPGRQHKSVNDYSNISLPANPFWQHNAIESIAAWINSFEQNAT